MAEPVTTSESVPIENLPLTATSQRGDRFLLFLYGLFAIAATGRSSYQLIARPAHAELAYWLSASAATCYVLGLGLLIAYSINRDRLSRRLATGWCLVELGGVITVGMWSILAPRTFAEPTVWSHFGSGYGFIPAVLPIGAVWWLRADRVAPTG